MTLPALFIAHGAPDLPLSGTPAAAARIVGLKTAHADPESALVLLRRHAPGARVLVIGGIGQEGVGPSWQRADGVVVLPKEASGDEIESLPGEFDRFVLQHHRHLPLELNLAIAELKAHGILIEAFEQSGSEDRVNLHGATDHALGKFVPSFRDIRRHAPIPSLWIQAFHVLPSHRSRLFRDRTPAVPLPVLTRPSVSAFL